MIKTKDISIRDYFQCEDTTEYDIFIDSIKPSNTFAGKKFKPMTFDAFKYITSIFREPDLVGVKEVFKECFDIRGSFDKSSEEEFFDASIFELFACKKFIQDYIVLRIDRENKALSGVPDEKMLMIDGYKRLAPVNHQLTKNQLAERFHCKPKDIGRWKYDEVFVILMADARQNAIQREKSQIK